MLEGVDEGPSPSPSLGLHGVQGAESYGVDEGDDGLDGVGHERSEHEAAEVGVVVALMEEDGFFSDHSFFAGWECGLEQMSFRNQN